MRHTLKVAVFVLVSAILVIGSPIVPVKTPVIEEDTADSKSGSRAISQSLQMSNSYPVDYVARGSFQVNRAYHQLGTTEHVTSSQDIRENGTTSYESGHDGLEKATANLYGTAADTLLPTTATLRNSSMVGLHSYNETENCTAEAAFLCLVDMVHFQRDKAVRINAIKDYVIRKLGLPTRVSQKPSIQDRNTPLEQNPSRPFYGHLETFYASCDVPPNADPDTWNSLLSFNIFFNVNSSMYLPLKSTQSHTAHDEDSHESIQTVVHRHAPHSRNVEETRHPSAMGDIRSGLQLSLSNKIASHRRVIIKSSNVVSGKLKLYKIGHGPQKENPFLKASSLVDPCNETMANDTSGKCKDGSSLTLPLDSIEEKIRVSVYWYTSPVQDVYVKKKLLDTKMLPLKESRWVEFDIQRATAIWLGTRENYGLAVQVENEDNELVDARKFFAGQHCTLSYRLKNSNTTKMETSGRVPVSQPEVGVLPPPVLEICILSLPTSKIPASFHNHESRELNFRHHRHSHTHAEAHQSIGNASSLNNLVSNGDVDVSLSSDSNDTRAQINPVTMADLSHRSSGKRFLLDEDHPLRQILATVASSNELRQSKDSKQHSAHPVSSRLIQQPISTVETSSRWQ